jgi:glycosyltransferase involved in cell wall biosynthesis
LSDRVEWRGEQPSADALLGVIDCLVLPSENEPFSLAMIEALNASVPVLRADSGGAVDVIEPGVNGWLFRSGDATDLTRVLRSLVETDVLAQVRIDREALQRFNAPVVAAQWAEVYARL